MLKFLCDYMTERLAIKITKQRHNGLSATITMEEDRYGGGDITESICVYKGVYGAQEGSVYLEVAFDKKKMERLDRGCPSLRSTHWEQDVTYYLGNGYADVPVYKLMRTDGSGYLRFNVTDYSEDKARKLFEAMLIYFPLAICKK
jgi:hypothetical protein